MRETDDRVKNEIRFRKGKKYLVGLLLQKNRNDIRHKTFQEFSDKKNID